MDSATVLDKDAAGASHHGSPSTFPSDLAPRLARILLGCVVVVAAVLAWYNRWLQDDAYITFRYSEHLAKGWGAVWNRGYAVEGYTNFLWMLVNAAGIRIGLSPGTTSELAGVACFIGSLLLVFRLARVLLERNDWALLTTALVAANYSFFSYATGGLETQSMALLTLAALLLAVEALSTGSLSVGRALAASVVLGLAALTRPDAVVFGAVAFGSLLWVALRTPAAGARTAVVAALVVPGLLIVGTWLDWKYSLYGRVLPNTFYAKVGARRPGTTERGLAYVGWLMLSYWWAPIAAGLFAVARRRGVALSELVTFRLRAAPLVVFAVLWCLYAVYVGGDIMEFRQLVPVIPVCVLLLVALSVRALPGRPAVGAVAALIVCGSVAHGLWFPRYVRPAGIGAIPYLRNVGPEDHAGNWEVMGQRLAEALPRSDVTIAVSPAGAIPYFSGLRSIDMVGLNDLWIPLHGHARTKCSVCTAHAQVATIAYLNDSGVNLVIGHPQTVTFAEPVPSAASVVRQMYYDEDMDYGGIRSDARLVRIPLHDDVALAALYLKPNADVDRLIAAGTWKAQPIEAALAGK